MSINGRSGSSGYTRKGLAAYRLNLTTVDKLVAPAVPTAADVATGGSLLAATSYHFAVAPANRWGSGPATVDGGAVTTASDASNTHVLRVTVVKNTQGGVDADGYNIFVSTDAAPKWVGYITETQRATAGCRITAVGTTDNAGANSAGTVDVQITGTGLQTSASPYVASASNTNSSVGIIDPSSASQYGSAINCAGYTYLILKIKLTVAQLTSASTSAMSFAVLEQGASGDWHMMPMYFGVQGTSVSPIFVVNVGSTPLSGGTLMGQVVIPILGATAIKIALLALSASVSGSVATLSYDLA